MKATYIIALTVAGLAGISAAPVSAAPKPVEQTQVAPLPEIWQKVPANQRLQYVRAAEIDAARILAERIVGIALDGETTVKDLAAADDNIKGALAATLKGIKTTEGPTYCEDGRVEVVRAVNLRSLLEVVVNKQGKGSSTFQKTVNETIDALGNSAIPGSLGHKHVMAKRAAEMDVYRRLAERALGVQVSSDTTVKDFVVESDVAKAKLASTLKSAEITAISYNADGTASVTATLKVGPLVRTIVRTRNAKGQVIKVDEKAEQMVLEETGSGVVKENAPAEQAPAAAPVQTQEVETIISEVLDSTATM